jgi:hypothetical protein
MTDYPKFVPPPKVEFDNDSRRLIRIETKLAKLMQHFGLTAEGQPVDAQQPRQSPQKENLK